MTNTRIGCERSSQQSCATRVIAPQTNRTHNHFRELRTSQDPATTHRAIIQYQFQEIFRPQWFGSIQWVPFITDYTSAVKETKHFRLKFLCTLLNKKPKKIPNPPERPRIIFFHEKSPVLINPQQPQNPRYKIAYHTHFHLEECPQPYDSWIQLDWLIRHKVAKGFHHFSSIDSQDNKGFVLKPWIKEHHANYNLKDYYRYNHHQDSDLVLDFESSDLQFKRD